MRRVACGCLTHNGARRYVYNQSRPLSICAVSVLASLCAYGLGSWMPHPEQPSEEKLAARNAELTERVSELLAVATEQAALI